jgi:hypothetical protein
MPCNATELVHFRKRIGVKGFNLIFKMSVALHGKSNVVTFRKTAKSILQQFYTGKQSQDRRYEKLELISTAAKIIKSDIREQEATKLVYPRISDLASRQANVDYVLETLRKILNIYGIRALLPIK